MKKLEKFQGKFFDKELSNEHLSKIRGGGFMASVTLTECKDTSKNTPDCGDKDVNDKDDCPEQLQ